MRLSELKPLWLERDGQRVGLTFMSPCGHGDRLTCFTEPTPFKEQVKLMHAAMMTTPEDENYWPIDWVPSNKNAKWELSNLDNFETLTVTPSIDASASGNWHGFVRDGNCN